MLAIRCEAQLTSSWLGLDSRDSRDSRHEVWVLPRFDRTTVPLPDGIIDDALDKVMTAAMRAHG